MKLNASHGNVNLPGHVAALPGTGFDYLHTRAAALHNHLWCQAGSMLCIVRAQLPERLLVLSFETPFPFVAWPASAIAICDLNVVSES